MTLFFMVHPESVRPKFTLGSFPRTVHAEPAPRSPPLLNLAALGADAHCDIGMIAEQSIDSRFPDKKVETFLERARVARQIVPAKRVRVQTQSRVMRPLHERLDARCLAGSAGHNL